MLEYLRADNLVRGDRFDAEPIVRDLLEMTADDDPERESLEVMLFTADYEFFEVEAVKADPENDQLVVIYSPSGNLAVGRDFKVELA